VAYMRGDTPSRLGAVDEQELIAFLSSIRINGIIRKSQTLILELRFKKFKRQAFSRAGA